MLLSGWVGTTMVAVLRHKIKLKGRKVFFSLPYCDKMKAGGDYRDMGESSWCSKFFSFLSRNSGKRPQDAVFRLLSFASIY